MKKLNKKFIIVMSLITAIILGVMAASFKSGNNMAASVMGAVFAPVQKYTAIALNSTGSFFKSLKNSQKNAKENKKLKKQISQLRDELRMIEGYKAENEKLQKLLELKNSRTEQKYTAANIIGRNIDDVNYTLTIDKGTADGVRPDSVVITDEGLVGVVLEAGINFAKIRTILDPGSAVSGICMRSSDLGIVEGGENLNSEICKMNYIDREARIVVGDYIETSGTGGIFPKGINIGKITDIRDDERGLMLVATVQPGVNLRNLCEVLVSVEK